MTIVLSKPRKKKRTFRKKKIAPWGLAPRTVKFVKASKLLRQKRKKQLRYYGKNKKLTNKRKNLGLPKIRVKWHQINQTCTQNWIEFVGASAWNRIHNLDTVIKGEDWNERASDTIKVLPMNFRWELCQLADTEHRYRFLCVQYFEKNWDETNNDYEAPDVLLTSTSSVSAAIESLYKAGDTRTVKFKVLFDKTLVWNSWSPNTISRSVNFSIPARTVKYDEGNGNILNGGNVCCFVMTTAPHNNVNYQSGHYYTMKWLDM